MPHLTRLTKPVSEKEIKREWHLFDAKDKILGRLVADIAKYLIGKNKINYVPYLDMGDFVVVINSKKIILSGKKETTKVYSYYSGYPGGLKKTPFLKILKEKPEEIIRHAVLGMLPKNKLRSRRMKRLFVFADEKHSYQNKFNPPAGG